MKVLVIFIGLAVAAANSSDCPNLTAVDSFSLPSFLGTWYQQYSYNNIFFQGLGWCANSNFTQDEESGTITVRNTQKSIFGEQEVDGYAILESASKGEFKMVVKSYFDIELTTDLLVLDTDYENYAVLYTCNKILDITYPCSWILTREKRPQSDTKAAIVSAMDAVAEKGGPSLKQFTATSQRFC